MNGIDEFKKLLRECRDTSFNCGEHRGPYAEYRVLDGKYRNAERACIEWVEKRVAAVNAAAAVVNNPAWAGVCDEDVVLETVLKLSTEMVLAGEACKECDGRGLVGNYRQCMGCKGTGRIRRAETVRKGTDILEKEEKGGEEQNTAADPA